MKKLDRREYDRRFSTGSSEQVMMAAKRFVKEVREAAAYNESDFSIVDFAVHEVLMELRNERFDVGSIASAAEYSAKVLRELDRKPKA